MNAASYSMLGNVHAIDEGGTLVATFINESQSAPHASTAGEVIFVGSQKFVPILETAIRRIREYNLP